ncbi:response regulator transcription factor [Cellulomonas sp. IC4_254]|uniref:response regulator n=1 Tax=Cellulomonas sp. IC4_254 TaxID=2714040 RepID=UPI0014214525|nr:response regulator transcription factor [Cellulomonas sp. IC4_254]NHT17624.1 response regulator transcription factor [Cellulomonas sp. IC4_254]
MTEDITVLLADDHHLVRSGLAGLVDAADGMRVVGQAADGAAAVALAADLAPDVILMDLSMPGTDGVEATREVLRQRPGTRVVVLTSFSDHDRVSAAVSAGAVGYLLKDCEPEELVAAVRSAAQGYSPLDPRVAGALLPSAAAPRPADRLSARERDVLRLLAKGLANKQIGRELGIAERTVKVHVGHVFRLLGVADRTSAALWAREHLPES